MRKVQFFTIVLYSVLLNACSSSQKVYDLSFDKDKGKEAEVGDFIKLKSGDTIQTDLKKFKIGMGLLNSKGSVTLANGSVQKMKDIEEFQMDSSYFKRAPNTTKRFYQRKKSGGINLYYRHVVDRGTSSTGSYYNYSYDLHYLQKADGPLEEFSLKLLRKMIADKPAVVALMKEYDDKPKKQKKNTDINNLIDVYNGKG